MLKIGDIKRTNTSGLLKIIGINENRANDGHLLYDVEFIDTGYRTTALESAIRRGRVKDKLLPNVANIGCIGHMETKITDPYVFIFYRSWNDMMNRCYNMNDTGYHKYGAVGITVDISWWAFDNFFRDAHQLPGIENKINMPDIYQLDKDYLQLDRPKNRRVYSKNTCMWISNYDNVVIMNMEYGMQSGYLGVIYQDHSWQTRIDNKCYGRFTTPEAAANMFNYIYPIVSGKYNNIPFKNDVEYIPIEELPKYAVKNR